MVLKNMKKQYEYMFYGDNYDFEDVREIEEWCVENIVDINDWWFDEKITRHSEGINYIGTQYEYVFGFKHDTDAMAFKILWVF